jgi:hypothetical protein
MLDESREIVRVLENKNNSNKLFKKWNIENKTNVKCSVDNCENDVNDNAYIVEISNIYKEFIIPLCQECYKLHYNRKNQSTSGLLTEETILGVDKNLLVEYTS